jgi:serine/threonine protein kinase
VGQPSSGHAITAAGAVMGTPAYMPREQAAGEPVDERADVYALGAILYHLVAGVPPYVSPHAPVILEEVLRGPPPPLGDREPQVPGELLTIVEKAMARDRAGRYPSARELAEDLRRFANGQIVSAHAYSQLERVRRVIRRNKVTVAVSVVGFVATSIVGAVIVQGMRDDRDHARLMQEEAEQRCGR